MNTTHFPKVPIAYGLDFGESHLALVKAVRRGARPRFEVLREKSGPFDAADLAALNNVITHEVVCGKASIMAAMPVRDSLTQQVETPLTSLPKACKVLPSLLDVGLPFPVESCACSFPDVRRTAAGQVQALAVAARLDAIRERMACLRYTGLDPVLLDHEGIALWERSLAEIPAGPFFRVVAFLTWDQASLVVGSGDQFEGAYPFRLDFSAVRDSEDVLGGETARAFSQRVNRILRPIGVQKLQDAMQWVWAGPVAEQRAVTETLQTDLQFSLRQDFFTVDHPFSFLARALAWRGLEPRARAVNFRDNKLAHPRLCEWRRRKQVGLAAAWLVAALLLCVLNITWSRLLQIRDTQAQQALQDVARQVTGLSRIDKGMEKDMVEHYLEKRRKQGSPFVRTFKPSLLRTLVDLLFMARKNGIELYEITLDDESVCIRGAAPDWNVPEKLNAYLIQKGYAPALKREDAGIDERVKFQL